MCEHGKKSIVTLGAGGEEPVGSRRRRLWEMPTNCHCPLVGVCLPLALLRRLVNKVVVRAIEGDDYDVHVWAVHECASRNRLSELLQRTLDERYAAILRQYRSLRDAAAVHGAWREAVARGDTAGAFWATLTHPRCDASLTEAVVRDMHMIQHQAGASVRVELARFVEVQQQNAAQAKELAQVREKAARAAEAASREKGQLITMAGELRAELVQRDAVIEGLRRELDALQAALPGLRDRERLVRRVEELEARESALAERVGELRRQLVLAPRPETAAAVAVADAPPPRLAEQQPATAPLELADKTVLCVGGRSGSVPYYRDLLEKEGARFLHHDGGLEQASEQLDASLAAADLVICQTGCISHKAYFRVKDFCKRTGKRCVFVDRPSSSSLALCLRTIEGESACAATGRELHC